MKIINRDFMIFRDRDDPESPVSGRIIQESVAIGDANDHAASL